MAKLISIGEGDPIPGREEILACKQEGWEIFCAFCVDVLTRTLNVRCWFREEGTARQIAVGVTTKVFLAFKKKPETLAKMKTVEEIKRYLRRASWNTRIALAIEQDKLARERLTPEEAEEEGKDLSERPDVPGLVFPDPERATAARELWALVEQACNELPAKRAKALERVVWGDSHKEIAQALGMKNEHAIGQELNRARQDLVRLLPKESIPALEMIVGGQLRKLYGEKQVSALSS